ncbi:DUF84 family protein [Aquibacillus sediminis]|uniref:DUF84 family protein n=1 Tax=Aquibacillus sediminis TaxID=2574734 RepID=UPI001109398A|nr:DUF84 family protein [Aquibacillus sediminis]
MKIYIGSKNPTKIKAVQNVFAHAEVEEVDVESKVSLQPYSDEETLEGAINRARECAAKSTSAIGIGLEGGVMEMDGALFLCNWGALVDETGETFTASGARIPLPEEIKQQLEKGIELGEIMDAYTQKKDIRKKQGAIGIFTNEFVGREEMFTHVLKLLKGQYEFYLQEKR